MQSDPEGVFWCRNDSLNMGIESTTKPHMVRKRVLDQGIWRWIEVKEGVDREVTKSFNGANAQSFYNTIILEIRLRGGVTAWYSHDWNHPDKATGPLRSWYYMSTRGERVEGGRDSVIFVAMPIDSNSPESALCVRGEGTLRGIYIPVSCPAAPDYRDKNAYAGINLTWYTGHVPQYSYHGGSFTRKGDYTTGNQREDGYKLNGATLVFAIRELALLLMVPRIMRKPDSPVSKYIYALDHGLLPGVELPLGYLGYLLENAFTVYDYCHKPYASVVSANTGVALTYPKEKVSAWWGVLRGLLTGAAACIPTVGPILAVGVNYIANAAITGEEQQRAHESHDPLLPQHGMTYEEASKVSADAVKFLNHLLAHLNKVKLFSSVHQDMLEGQCSVAEYNEAFKDSYNFELLVAYEGKSDKEIEAAITAATQAGEYFSMDPNIHTSKRVEEQEPDNKDATDLHER